MAKSIAFGLKKKALAPLEIGNAPSDYSRNFEKRFRKPVVVALKSLLF